MSIVMDAKIKFVMAHYDFNTQRDMLVEECAELIQATNKCKRNCEGAFKNYISELADVAILVEQMMQFVGKEEVIKMMNYKLDRQIDRINEEGLVSNADTNLQDPTNTRRSYGDASCKY